MWRGYGFLVETDGVLKKTALFEAAWRDRRKRWIDLVHNGDPTGVIELETTLSSASDKGAGRNRVCPHPYSPSLVLLFRIIHTKILTVF
jgi:hypothetical protein